MDRTPPRGIQATVSHCKLGLMKMSRTAELMWKRGSGRLFYGLGREEMVFLVGKGGAEGNPRTGRNLRKGLCDTI